MPFRATKNLCLAICQYRPCLLHILFYCNSLIIYFVLDKQSLEEGSKTSTSKSEIQNIEDIENETGKI
jgi:hypothetical protein